VVYFSVLYISELLVMSYYRLTCVAFSQCLLALAAIYILVYYFFLNFFFTKAVTGAVHFHYRFNMHLLVVNKV